MDERPDEPNRPPEPHETPTEVAPPAAPPAFSGSAAHDGPTETMTGATPAAPVSGRKRLGLDLDRVSVVLILALAVPVVLWPIEIYQAFGLPLHVMLVHAPVVLIPILAITTVAVLWNERWRTVAALPLAVAGIVVSAFTTLAGGAGEALKDHLDEGQQALGRLTAQQGESLIDRHADAGGDLRILMLLFAVSLVALAVHVRTRTNLEANAGARVDPTNPPHGAAPEGTTESGTTGPAAPVASRRASRSMEIGIVAATAALAAASLGWVVYTGHLGSRAAWEDRTSDQSRAGQIGRSPSSPLGPGANGDTGTNGGSRGVLPDPDGDGTPYYGRYGNGSGPNQPGPARPNS